MSDSPQTILAEERATDGVRVLKQYLNGKIPWRTVLDYETSLKLTGLKARRDAAIAKLSDDKAGSSWPKDDAASAYFLAAIYRDAKYAAGGRRYHQYLGAGAMLRGFYEGAKTAVDNNINMA